MSSADRYTYENAGFNAFMLRSMKSNAGAQTVRGGISTGSGTPIAFDRQQIGGMVGDKLKIGRVIINGSAGRLEFLDKSETTQIGWAGDLTE